MLKLIPRYKQGNKSPDHDPDNPYHYHNAKGEKVVITPEDWEANVGKPYFREIEAAVKAEQAAYPGPEYEVNPAFVRDLNNSVATVRGQNGMLNYVGYKNQLPQGYTINENGIIFDDKGQAYVQESYPQSARFTYNTDSPLQFTFNQGKPIERNVNFYPVNMDKRVKESLPVDRIMNVNNEYNQAVNDYIKNNTTPKKKIHYINSAFVSYLHPEIAATDDRNDYNRAIKNAKKLGYRVLENYKPGQFNSFLIGFDDNEFNEWQKEMYDRFGEEGEVYLDNTTLKRTINGDTWSNGPNGPNGPMGYQVRYEGGAPSRKEAEKKAVISIGPLEKVKTFATGGSLGKVTPYGQNYVTEYPLHKFQRGGYITNGRTLADGRTVYPISDLPAEDTSTSLPAARIALKPVVITAKHPLWDLPDYKGKEDNPNINAHKNELYQNRKRREEAGKEYLKNIGRVGLTMATLPILGYGATTAPLATGLSLAGGEGLNYGINKLTPYDSWGNMLAEGMFNTDNELAQTALEFTNPGFLLGPKAAPFVNNQYRGLRVANALKKGINNATKYGDIRVSESSFRDPTKFYRFVEQPEVGTIEELGFNVTSRDALDIPSLSNTFRVNTVNNESRIEAAKNPFGMSLRKLGSAHGNVSQASAMQPWSGSVAQNNLFKNGILEGNLPSTILASNGNRSVFHPVNSSDLIAGQRIGFKTGTMPVENLRYFEDLGNGTFKYNGQVIPERRIYLTNIEESIPTLEQAYQEGMNAKVQGSSIYKSSPEEGHDFLTKIYLGQIVDPSTSFKVPNYLYRSGIDYIERGISPEVRNIVETQVKPRLLTEDTRFYLASRDPSYARDFNNAIDETVKSTKVSEWSKGMMEDYNRVNNVNWGGFSLNDKPRVILGKNSNMPVSTTETHELRHQLQKSIPRTPTEQDILKEAYSDAPQPRKGDGSIDASYDMSQEWETMNTEARKILLEKAGYKYDATKSLEDNVIEQDRILENYKNSDLVQTLHDEADGYWRRFIDEFQSKTTEEKRAKVAAWKKAMQLVGVGTGVIATPKLINRE